MVPRVRLNKFQPLAFPNPLLNTATVQLTVTQLTDRLVASYARAGGINHLDGKNLPSKRVVTDQSPLICCGCYFQVFLTRN